MVLVRVLRFLLASRILGVECKESKSGSNKGGIGLVDVPSGVMNKAGIFSDVHICVEL